MTASKALYLIGFTVFVIAGWCGFKVFHIAKRRMGYMPVSRYDRGDDDVLHGDGTSI